MKCVVNEEVVETRDSPGRPALDFIREDLGLKGTKEGCREGDCGACSVLLGERLGDTDSGFAYRAVPSCLLALGELGGRQVLTIEGLAAGARARGLPDSLTPVMAALLEENGSQCGFCSPGVVINLTAWLMSCHILDEASAVRAVEGNLCRCTGYGAIRRASLRLAADFAGLPLDPVSRIAALVEAGVLPRSVQAFIEGRLLEDAGPGVAAPGARPALGGGTDFFVRTPDPEPGFAPRLVDREEGFGRIGAGAEGLSLGAGATVEAFFASPLVRSLVPGIEAYEADFASSLIRSRATLGGNVANASPVGDLTSILMALGAQVEIQGPGGRRSLPLERLYLGYKKLDLREGEFLASFLVAPAAQGRLGFSFEKVSKRRRLDIASVNTAARLEIGGSPEKPLILKARISAGGMGPTPLYLAKASAFLEGKAASAGVAKEAAALGVAETSPMGDVRGSADYRRRLLERLILGHFLRLFPQSGIAEELFP